MTTAVAKEKTEIAKTDKNELAAPATLAGLPSTSMASDAYKDLAKGGGFLQRMQLFSKGEAIDKGLIRPGRYGIPESKDNVIELGDCIDVLPLARRPKALDLSDTSDIVTVYDHNDPEFERIKELADSGKPNTGCMYGVSFLVIERKTGRYLEWFLGSKSSRPEAGKVYPFLPVSEGEAKETGVEPRGPNAMTLKSRLVKNKNKNTWYVPVVTECSTPVDFNETEAVEQIKKFLNPPKSDVVDAPKNERDR